ncbi:hypothetical protein GWI33_015366 [Rhynchophorus ferrugineus]|uniref:Uncharacterized protein n=1 Tax=Rhynchophorus ferrugineus TaxID=354439 RepID=A0A834I3H6_RHYFE|nr:hypothetical protein GWI33_015366 [Rhynchophorus ferrugineus]
MHNETSPYVPHAANPISITSLFIHTVNNLWQPSFVTAGRRFRIDHSRIDDDDDIMATFSAFPAARFRRPPRPRRPLGPPGAP